MMLLITSFSISPSLALGDFVSNTASVSAPFGDDQHTSTLNPYPFIPVSTITYVGHPELNGQCSWINTGLSAFKAAPGNSGWTWNWAGVAQEAASEKGISLVPYRYDFGDGKGTQTYSGYNPFVVRCPEVTAAPGTGISFPATAPGEYGGAVINLQYTPQPDLEIGIKKGHSLHWIQAYTGTLWGHTIPPLLDNDPDNPYRAQSGVTPFYDEVTRAAGTLTGGGGYFDDRPLIPEFDSFWTHKEYESNPVASLQYQVVLADFDEAEKHITVYGGVWWGFTYSAVDIPNPEPSSCFLMALGGGGLLIFRRMRRCDDDR
jgi:hypothetical protein